MNGFMWHQRRIVKEDHNYLLFSYHNPFLLTDDPFAHLFIAFALQKLVLILKYITVTPVKRMACIFICLVKSNTTLSVLR